MKILKVEYKTPTGYTKIRRGVKLLETDLYPSPYFNCSFVCLEWIPLGYTGRYATEYDYYIRKKNLPNVKSN